MAKGIVRKLDELGRITIPKEFRRTYGIEEKDPLGLFVDDDTIYLIKNAEGFHGVVRNLDDLGRYTLPIEVRRTLGYIENQEVDIFIEPLEDAICIRKSGDYCKICGSTQDLHSVDIPKKEVKVCKCCAVVVADMVFTKEL
jgi:AbrB family looped-hinge helix DNA binding protein